MKSAAVLIAVLIVGGVCFYASAFVIKETEQAAVQQFGEVMRLVDKPGLHFVVPFVQEVKRFDKRWLEWDGDANQITTRDKRYIYIDVFARWRIKNLKVFIENLRDETSALGRLDDILDNATRNVVANHRLIEAIRASNREFEYDGEGDIRSTKSGPHPEDATKDAAAGNASASATAEASTDAAASGAPGDVPANAPPNDSSSSGHSGNAQQRLSEDADTYAIEVGREKLTRLILEKASVKAAELGIEIKDVQIKRVNYIESVEMKVFDRMISERRRAAEAYRSEGRGRSAEILGRTEMELKQIQSEAYRESQKIMGRADAKAAEIYSAAYGKNPEFYQFLKTMESYNQTIDGSYSLILSTDGDYAGHLQSMKGTPTGN